ncbi:MAG: complex I subunit 4 family protein [Thermoplasmata archaeon]
MTPPILSLTLLTLLVGTIATFASGTRARWVALATSFVFLAEIGLMFWGFSLSDAGGLTVPTFAYTETYAWISLGWLNINFALGVDGISLVLILLTGILQVATVIYSWTESKRPAAWFGLVLLTCLGCFGVFISLDILFFFLFWEAVLVPMFFIIGYWGGPNRRYAALKFFIYTHVASIVMLVGLLAVAFYSGATSFDFSSIAAVAPTVIATVPAAFLFLALFFGFGVKFPVVPFHTWLPDAHVEAPTGGSVLLAGLLLKLGGFGLIRWAVEVLPQGFHVDQPILFVIAMISIIWGSVLALAQRDLKRMVAYSSINHMGIVLLAISLNSELGLIAAVFLMFAHGIVSGLLFMGAGSVHHTYGTRDLATLGGIAPVTPRLATAIMIGSLASLGLPALIGFPAEFTALLATWEGIGGYVLIPLIVLVVTAGFYLWMTQRLLYGPPRAIPAHVHDLPWYESTGMGVLIGVTVLFGILPFLLVNVITQSPIGVWPL